jgi:molybdopterin-guanine dinucleotide biosynthesis protein A
MNRTEAFILAGGASSRMGTDKSQLLIEGETFVERIATTLFKVVGKVTIVGRESKDPRCASVADLFPKWGALGGLHAALAACQSEWALVVACDLPFIRAELLERIASVRGGFDAVVPQQADGRPQPLVGIYRVVPCRDKAAELIHANKRRPLDLLESVQTRWLPFSEIKDLDHAEEFFVNINTREDYYEATQKGT